MKKIITKLLLLLIILIPSSIKAYTYEGTSINIDTLKNKGWITKWPTSTEVSNFYVNSDSKINNSNYFFYHSVNNNSNSYIGFSSNIGKTASDTSTNNYPMDLVNNFDTLNNNHNNMTDEQRELLEDLIVNGYHYDSTNTQKINGVITKKESTLSMMAMQILVWEVMEGARNSFDDYAPNVWNGTYSFYNQVVYPNGGAGRTSGTLYYYYTKIIDDVYSGSNPSSASAFNNDFYALSWDGTNKKYTTTITGLGKYNSCYSSNPDITVSNNLTSVTLTSTKAIQESTVSCSYVAGSGTNDNFYYFKFQKQNNCSTESNCSRIIYGTGKKIYSKSFDVSTESTNIYINKIGIDKKKLDGAKFKLTHRTTTNYSLTINGNDKEGTPINKSGEYIVDEVVIPSGYEKVSDFNIKLDVKSGRITDCTNKGKDSSDNLTCMGGQVIVTYDNKKITLTVVDPIKNFKIQKVDENNRPLKGSTFQIRDSKNQVMKFSKYEGNIFSYDKNGSITDLVINDASSYPISLLPAGEYTVVETNPTKPYRLPSKDEDKSTKIEVKSNGDLYVYDYSQKKYVSAVNSSVVIKNYRTLVRIISTEKGTPIEGIKYALYSSDKTTEIKSNLIQSGVYNYEDDQSIANSNEYITNKDGLITVYDLPVGTYYFKQKDAQNASFIEIRIDVTRSGATVNGSRVINTMNLSGTKDSFSFYKVDEEGNYISSGKFKLQKYDESKKRYVDIRLVQVENDGTYNEKSDIFKESKDGKVQFTLTNGIGTFIEMTSSTKYRVVETVAPTGYVRGSTNDTANVTLDEKGNAYGMLVLTNKKILSDDGQARAELIINIDTGQNRIRYAIIIGSIIIIIGVLVILQRKKK